MAKAYQILTALKTQLETISTANGYNHTVQSVHIGMRNPDKINDRPTLDLEGQGTDHQYFQGADNTLSTLTVVVRGYVDPTRDAVKQQWDLIQDITSAVSSNITLGLDFVFNLKYDESATDGGLTLLDRYPRMIFVLLTISYEHLATDF